MLSLVPMGPFVFYQLRASNLLIGVSIEYCEASMEELYKLKEEGQLSSTLLDDKSALSNSSNPEISRLWINLMKLGFLSLEIQVDRKIIFTLDTSKSLSISVLPISNSTLFYLSPFCWIRPSNGNFIIQDASQICQLTIHDVKYMKVISELSKSTTIESSECILRKTAWGSMRRCLI